MTAFLIKFGLVLLIAVVVGGMVWRTVGRGKPNTVRGFPDRQRLPRTAAIVGAVLVVIGSMMVLAAFTTGEWRDLFPLRIASVVVLVTGILFLVGYRNRYVAPGRDAVRYRTLLGREKTMRYADITSYKGTTGGGKPQLVLRAGRDSLRVNPAFYDLTPIYAALRERERAGR